MLDEPLGFVPTILRMTTSVIGVPASRQQRILNQYTTGGAIDTSVDRYVDDEAMNFAEAVASVETGLDRYASSGLDTKYHRALVDMYHVPGLGDTDWGGVFKEFVGQVGKGVAGRIAGANPFVTSTTVNTGAPAGAASETPKWVKPLVIVGVAVTGFFVVRSLMKR